MNGILRRGVDSLRSGGETLSLPDYRPLRYNKTDLVNPWFFCRARKMPGCRPEAEMMVGECSAAD
ncbi:MAG: hypothetical protein ACLURY_01805 [Alistipes putredinis]